MTPKSGTPQAVTPKSGTRQVATRAATVGRRLWKAAGSALKAEDGSEVVSFVLLAPFIIVFFELILVGGRLATTHADVESAARDAARHASLAAGGSTADANISAVAETALADKGLSCVWFSAEIGNDTEFVPGGWVEVEVTCIVETADLGFLSAPGSFSITRGATEPIDLFRVVED